VFKITPLGLTDISALFAGGVVFVSISLLYQAMAGKKVEAR
jgi:hypothetical protein